MSENELVDHPYRYSGDDPYYRERCPVRVQIEVPNENGGSYTVRAQCSRRVHHAQSPYTRSHHFELARPEDVADFEANRPTKPKGDRTSEGSP